MGFDLNRFSSPIEPTLCCGLCGFVLQNPVQLDCSVDLHSFCRTCLIDRFALTVNPSRCPIDGKPFKRNNRRQVLQPPSDLLQSRLNALHIRCAFAQTGCPAIVLLCDLDWHEQNCTFNHGPPIHLNHNEIVTQSAVARVDSSSHSFGTNPLMMDSYSTGPPIGSFGASGGYTMMGSSAAGVGQITHSSVLTSNVQSTTGSWLDWSTNTSGSGSYELHPPPPPQSPHPSSSLSAVAAAAALSMNAVSSESTCQTHSPMQSMQSMMSNHNALSRSSVMYSTYGSNPLNSPNSLHLNASHGSIGSPANSTGSLPNSIGSNGSPLNTGHSTHLSRPPSVAPPMYVPYASTSNGSNNSMPNSPMYPTNGAPFTLNATVSSNISNTSSSSSSSSSSLSFSPSSCSPMPSGRHGSVTAQMSPPQQTSTLRSPVQKCPVVGGNQPSPLNSSPLAQQHSPLMAYPPQCHTPQMTTFSGANISSQQHSILNNSNNSLAFSGNSGHNSNHHNAGSCKSNVQSLQSSQIASNVQLSQPNMSPQQSQPMSHAHEQSQQPPVSSATLSTSNGSLLLSHNLPAIPIASVTPVKLSPEVERLIESKCNKAEALAQQRYDELMVRVERRLEQMSAHTMDSVGKRLHYELQSVSDCARNTVQIAEVRLKNEIEQLRRSMIIDGSGNNGATGNNSVAGDSNTGAGTNSSSDLDTMANRGPKKQRLLFRANVATSITQEDAADHTNADCEQRLALRFESFRQKTQELYDRECDKLLHLIQRQQQQMDRLTKQLGDVMLVTRQIERAEPKTRQQRRIEAMLGKMPNPIDPDTDSVVLGDVEVTIQPAVSASNISGEETSTKGAKVIGRGRPGRPRKRPLPTDISIATIEDQAQSSVANNSIESISAGNPVDLIEPIGPSINSDQTQTETKQIDELIINESKSIDSKVIEANVTTNLNKSESTQETKKITEIRECENQSSSYELNLTDETIDKQITAANSPKKDNTKEASKKNSENDSSEMKYEPEVDQESTKVEKKLTKNNKKSKKVCKSKANSEDLLAKIVNDVLFAEEASPSMAMMSRTMSSTITSGTDNSSITNSGWDMFNGSNATIIRPIFESDALAMNNKILVSVTRPIKTNGSAPSSMLFVANSITHSQQMPTTCSLPVPSNETTLRNSLESSEIEINNIDEKKTDECNTEKPTNETSDEKTNRNVTNRRKIRSNTILKPTRTSGRVTKRMQDKLAEKEAEEIKKQSQALDTSLQLIENTESEQSIVNATETIKQSIVAELSEKQPKRKNDDPICALEIDQVSSKSVPKLKICLNKSTSGQSQVKLTQKWNNSKQAAEREMAFDCNTETEPEEEETEESTNSSVNLCKAKASESIELAIELNKIDVVPKLIKKSKGKKVSKSNKSDTKSKLLSKQSEKLEHQSIKCASAIIEHEISKDANDKWIEVKNELNVNKAQSTIESTIQCDLNNKNVAATDDHGREENIAATICLKQPNKVKSKTKRRRRSSDYICRRRTRSRVAARKEAATPVNKVSAEPEVIIDKNDENTEVKQIENGEAVESAVNLLTEKIKVKSIKSKEDEAVDSIELSNASIKEKQPKRTRKSVKSEPLSTSKANVTKRMKRNAIVETAFSVDEHARIHSEKESSKNSNMADVIDTNEKMDTAEAIVNDKIVVESSVLSKRTRKIRSVLSMESKDKLNSKSIAIKKRAKPNKSNLVEMVCKSATIAATRTKRQKKVETESSVNEIDDESTTKSGDPTEMKLQSVDETIESVVAKTKRSGGGKRNAKKMPYKVEPSGGKAGKDVEIERKTVTKTKSKSRTKKRVTSKKGAKSKSAKKCIESKQEDVGQAVHEEDVDKSVNNSVETEKVSIEKTLTNEAEIGHLIDFILETIERQSLECDQTSSSWLTASDSEAKVSQSVIESVVQITGKTVLTSLDSLEISPMADIPDEESSMDDEDKSLGFNPSRFPCLTACSATIDAVSSG